MHFLVHSWLFGLEYGVDERKARRFAIIDRRERFSHISVSSLLYNWIKPKKNKMARGLILPQSTWCKHPLAGKCRSWRRHYVMIDIVTNDQIHNVYGRIRILWWPFLLHLGLANHLDTIVSPEKFFRYLFSLIFFSPNMGTHEAIVL